MAKPAAEPVTLPSPHTPLQRRILDHLEGRTGDTELMMCEVLGTRREVLAPNLEALENRGDVASVWVEHLRIFRLSLGETVPIMTRQEKANVLLLLKALRQSSSSVGMDAMWRLAKAEDITAAGRELVTRLEYLRLIYPVHQNTFRITPAGRKFLEVNL